MNKSTVFSVGNRLSKTMPRSDAFVQAWAIVRKGEATFPVRGVMQGSRQEALRRLAKYDPSQVRTFLMPEKENPVDKNAVLVMVGINGGKNYYKLGYIPASDTGIATAIRGKATIKIIGGDIQGARLTLTLAVAG